METGHHTKNAAVETPGLGERLEVCADKLGSKKALGDAAGISQAQLFRYIRGESEIPAAKALHVARVAKVDPTWLLSGDGKPEGIVIPQRPEFRPELMAKLTQVFTEVMADYPNRLSPYQRGKFLALAYESMRAEELDRNITWVPSRNDVFNMLEYLGRQSFDELLDIHAQAYPQLALGTPVVDASQELFWGTHFCNAVHQGNNNLFSGAHGESFFRRVGSVHLSEDSANRLLTLIAAAKKNQPDGVKMRWLDLGCGNGREMEFVMRQANADCYGIETAEAALKELAAREKSGQWPAGRVVAGDMRMIPHPDRSFDVVYSRMSLFCIPYLPDDSEQGFELCVKEMARVAKPNGLVSVVTVRGKGFYLMPYVQLIETKELIEMGKRHGLEAVSHREFDLANANERVRKQVEVLFRKVK